MSTTTIRLPDDPKARIAEAAGSGGHHAAQLHPAGHRGKAELEERRAAFHAEAVRRYDEIIATAKPSPGKPCAPISKRAPVARKLRAPKPQETAR